MRIKSIVSLCALVTTLSSCAHEHHKGGIQANKGNGVLAPFDIIHTKITSKGNVAIFHMAVSGKAGISKPTTNGKLAGSDVFSYVWPTSIDSYVVGFEKQAGILALAVTSHPDFDDTPLYDENSDGAAMMEMSGIVIGLYCNQMNNAVRVH